jgi:hypothetical protein
MKVGTCDLTLTCKDLNLVHGKLLSVCAISLDDGHVVLVDREHIVWIAGQRDNPKAIAEDDISFDDTKR